MNDVLPEMTSRVLSSAIEVHRLLGPGMLERTYQACLARKLALDGMNVAVEVPIPINYKGVELEVAYRADMIVEGKVILELKAVEKIALVHETQMLTYLKLTKLPVGLILNFNVRRLSNGVRRFIRRTAVHDAVST